MTYPTMQAGRVLNTMSRMTRGTRMVRSFVRSFVQTCIRTTSASRRSVAARAMSLQAEMRAEATRITGSGDRRDAREGREGRDACPPHGERGARVAPIQRYVDTADSRGTTRGQPATAAAVKAPRPTAPLELPTTQPSFTRVSTRRGAMPATPNPVRIYSTPSRTVMVGNLSEVSRLLDLSIEREQARLVRHA